MSKPRKPDAPGYKEWHHNIVAAGVDKIKEKYPNAKIEPPDIIEAKVKAITANVLHKLRPIIQAGGAVKPSDLKNGLGPMVFESVAQQVETDMNEEELSLFATMSIGGMIMSEIEANPWGGDKPDALSGQ